MVGVNYNDRILVVGKTQSGKTTFVQHVLFAQMHGARRVAIDPKGHLELGVTPIRRAHELDPREPLLHFIPRTTKMDELEEVYARLWEIGGPTVVWLDEAMGPTTQNRWPEHMAITIQQGAQRGVGHWACSQRPVAIAPPLRTEAEHIFAFVPRPHMLNIQALSLEFGMGADELAYRFDELQSSQGDYSFLWYCRATNELAGCAPIPLSTAPAADTAVDEDEQQDEPQEELEPANTGE